MTNRSFGHQERRWRAIVPLYFLRHVRDSSRAVRLCSRLRADRIPGRTGPRRGRPEGRQREHRYGERAAGGREVGRRTHARRGHAQGARSRGGRQAHRAERMAHRRRRFRGRDRALLARLLAFQGRKGRGHGRRYDDRARAFDRALPLRLLVGRRAPQPLHFARRDRRHGHKPRGVLALGPAAPLRTLHRSRGRARPVEAQGERAEPSCRAPRGR